MPPPHMVRGSRSPLGRQSLLRGRALAPHLQRAQCVPVRIAQSLQAAFEEFKAAIGEHEEAMAAPLGVVAAKVEPKVFAMQPGALSVKREALPPALPTVPAATKAELAAKEKTIQGKEAALQSKNKELESMKAQLDSKESLLAKARDDQKDSLKAIIDGAMAKGACMHLHLHVITKSNDHFLDLLGQFTGRCKNQ